MTFQGLDIDLQVKTNFFFYQARQHFCLLWNTIIFLFIHFGISIILDISTIPKYYKKNDYALNTLNKII